MLKKMREVWDNAPSNPALDGQASASRAIVVPLEEDKDGLKEFLLVPYFGACVHSPPPPANQIIHVLPQSPAQGRALDGPGVDQRHAGAREDRLVHGRGGYRMQAKTVEPYVERPR
jgi:hypothetical protein